MTEDLYYSMERRRMGSAIIINNLDLEQPPTKNDVKSMSEVLKTIGFDVEIHVNLTSQGMNNVKRKMTEEGKHKDANCFLMLIISHGTADNFIVDKEGNKTWNIESLVTEVCDVQSLVGKPKLFFIEACRGKESNFSTQMMTKSSLPPQQSGISLPSKQDVFVGFATVPGFVSFTSMKGSPYLQALSSLLEAHHSTTDLSDIHLLVKRKLAGMKLGADGARQGAEERSSLLSKLLFSKYGGSHKGKVVEPSESLLDKISTFSPFAPRKQDFETESISIPIKIENSPAVINSSPKPSLAEPRSTSIDLPSLSSSPAGNLTNYKRPTNLTFTAFGKPQRSAFFSSPISSSSPIGSPEVNWMSPSHLQKPPITLKITPTPSIFTSPSSPKPTMHSVEIQSTDIENGLKSLLEKVIEIYGGEGKVKVKKHKKKKDNYSVKFIGPEKAANLLEKSLKSVKELQSKDNPWKFTQRIEVSTV